MKPKKPNPLPKPLRRHSVVVDHLLMKNKTLGQLAEEYRCNPAGVARAVGTTVPNVFHFLERHHQDPHHKGPRHSEISHAERLLHLQNVSLTDFLLEAERTPAVILAQKYRLEADQLRRLIRAHQIKPVLLNERKKEWLRIKSIEREKEKKELVKMHLAECLNELGINKPLKEFDHWRRQEKNAFIHFLTARTLLSQGTIIRITQEINAESTKIKMKK